MSEAKSKMFGQNTGLTFLSYENFVIWRDDEQFLISNEHLTYFNSFLLLFVLCRTHYKSSPKSDYFKAPSILYLGFCILRQWRKRPRKLMKVSECQSYLTSRRTLVRQTAAHILGKVNMDSSKKSLTPSNFQVTMSAINWKTENVIKNHQIIFVNSCYNVIFIEF